MSAIPVAKRWTVDIYLSETTVSGGGSITHAEAHLDRQGSERLRGHGTARSHPEDAEVPGVGDELAVARALLDVAHQLLQAAAGHIDAVTDTRVARLSD